MKFEPSPRLVGWARRLWPDLTADDLRCLWVLEQHLAEQDRRYYHLPSSPPPRRIGEFGFEFAVDSFGSFDGAGLSWLAIAAHVAHVRVEVGVRAVYHTDPDDFEAPVDWVTNDWDEHDPTGAVLVLRLDPYQPSLNLFRRTHPGPERLASLLAALP